MEGGMAGIVAEAREDTYDMQCFPLYSLLLAAGKGDIFRLCSHWSKSYSTGLSLVGSFTVMKHFHSDATLALLRHKNHLKPPKGSY